MPRTRLADAVREITAAAERHGVRIFTFAHAADGNLHPILVLDPDVPGIPDAGSHVGGSATRLGVPPLGECVPDVAGQAGI